jgi:hypothetical protein
MISGIRQGLTYANVMSTIAVFGVLAGGTAWAACKIGSEDIKNNAVLSKHIKDGQVKRADLAANALPGLNLTVRSADGDGNGSAEAITECNAGELAVGGGVNVQKATANERISSLVSRPSPNQVGSVPTAWEGKVFYETATPGATVRTYVVCASD